MIKIGSMTARRLYIIAVDRVQRELGEAAWEEVLSARMRRGLIAHELLTLLASEPVGEAIKRDSAEWNVLICDLEQLVNENDPKERV